MLHNQAAQQRLQRKQKPRRLILGHQLKQGSHDEVRIESKNKLGEHGLQTPLSCIVASVLVAFGGVLAPPAGPTLLAAENLFQCLIVNEEEERQQEGWPVGRRKW
jgi:hypothetical protein